MIYIVLILSFLLRLVSLNQSLWLDEATTALVARMDLSEFFTKFMPADFHPPLYYLVVNLWSSFFGYSEIALRMPSVIFGVLTIYIVYLIAKDLKYRWPIVPALFLATSGLHIYYSQEARMYSMATFLVSLIFLLFIKKQWFLMSISFVLLFFTDYLSVIVVPVLFLYQFMVNRKDFGKFLILIVPVWTAFLFWWPTLNQQLSAGLSLKESSSAWWNALGPVTIKNVALIPTKFLIGRVSFDNKILYGLIMVIISVIFMYVIGKAKNKLMWYWFAGSLVIGIILSFYIPTLTYFRYLFILPAFYLLLAETKSKLFIGFVLVINILASYFYLTQARFQRENWRELPNIVRNEKLLLPSYSQREVLIYYGLDNQIVSVDEVKTTSPSPIWLSRYVVNISDPSDSTRKYLENLGYNWSEEINLNGVVFWKYTK
ncbi:glycosyltransferase family 39 protein [Candidatus Dojkabacteria bacterium]|nr:glycosyltransferase family 39 protein [Candidatus Dojkabacteria bacterium]